MNKIVFMTSPKARTSCHISIFTMPRPSSRRATAEDILEAYIYLRRGQTYARTQYKYRRSHRSTSRLGHQSSSPSTDSTSSLNLSDSLWSESSDEDDSNSQLSTFSLMSIDSVGFSFSDETSTSDDDYDADCESVLDSDSTEDFEESVSDLAFESNLGHHICMFVASLYAKRYLQPRDHILRTTQPFLHHILTVHKLSRPDLFRQQLRISPWSFDRLVDSIVSDPIFSNNSNCPQLPVEQQLAIALYRFGHSGNALLS